MVWRDHRQSSRNITPGVGVLKGPGFSEDAPPEYTPVDYQTNVSLAADVAHEIFVDRFRLREPRLRIECDGMGFSHVPVTRPGYPTFGEQLREMREHLREMWNLLRNR